jgi:formylglycine-generating enzyme required for sulfatase activity
MENPPVLEIGITLTNQNTGQITLRFSDPRSAVLPNDYPGSWTRPSGLAHPEDDPTAHGRALRDALVHDPAVRNEFSRALNETVRNKDPRELRVYLRLPPELQEYSWETLLDPDVDQPLLGRSQIYFFRFLGGTEPIVPSTARPRVLVFIANPERLGKEAVVSGNVRLHPVDVDGELARARQGLRPLVPTEIASVPGRKGEASLDGLISALRNAPDPYDILYLVCHGALYSDGAKLWLDEQNDDPVRAQLLVEGLYGLGAEKRPRLVVLASCQSAGQPGTEPEATIDRRAIAAIGPKLVQEAGVAAVVAMQGNVFMRSVEVMIPAFFQELVKSGQVEQAMASARGRMRIQVDPLVRNQWRVPVLFSRLANGQIWLGDAARDIQRKPFEPETVLIPAGEFKMGSDPGPGIPEHETPQHPVTLPAYFIGKYPVTNAEFAVFLQRQPAHPALPPEARWLGRMPPKGRKPHPVTWVSWSDAQAYCRWLSRQTGNIYCLPTEAEWEKAARGPLGLIYPWGNDWADDCCNIESQGTTPITEHGNGASPYDCQDLVGNVEEWTATIWGTDDIAPEFGYPYDATDGREDPARGGDQEPRLNRVYRGCAFSATRAAARCARRGGSDQTTRVPWRGFRVMMKVVQHDR